MQRDAGRLPRIEALKAEHPFWGYRRIWAYLRRVEHLPVNKQRILRLSASSSCWSHPIRG
jgi:putative transposase